MNKGMLTDRQKKPGCLKAVLVCIGVFIIVCIVFSLFSEKEDVKNRNTTIKTDFSSSNISEENEPISRQEADSLNQAELTEVSLKIKRMSSLFKYSFDEFDEMTWIEHRDIPKYNNSNGFYTYIGRSKNRDLTEHLVMRYYGDEWLFVEKITVITGDSKIEMSANMKKDHNSSVWEWMDVIPNKKQQNMIASIISTKKAKVRFSGNKYHNDRDLTQKEIKTLSETQEYFDLLKRQKELEYKIRNLVTP